MDRPTLAAMSVANLTIGRIDPVRVVEDAAAAGFRRVGLLRLPTEAARRTRAFLHACPPPPDAKEPAP